MTKPSKTNRQIQGMTLIELAVVFAIMLSLSSLLMPTLKKLLTHAKNVHCKSNLMVWAKVFSSYAEDSDDWLPPAYRGPDNPALSWMQRIDIVMEKKLKDYQYGLGNDFGIWQCPENELQAYVGGLGLGERSHSYQPNGWDLIPLYLSTKVTQHKFPSKLYALYDGMYYRSAPWANDGQHTIYTLGVHAVRYAHSFGYNMLYSDGHIEYFNDGPLLYRGTYLGGTGNDSSSYSNGKSWYAY